MFKYMCSSMSVLLSCANQQEYHSAGCHLRYFFTCLRWRVQPQLGLVQGWTRHEHAYLQEGPNNTSYTMHACLPDRSKLRCQKFNRRRAFYQQVALGAWNASVAACAPATSGYHCSWMGVPKPRASTVRGARAPVGALGCCKNNVLSRV